MATRLTIVDGNNNDKDNVRVYMVKGEKGGATWGQIDGIVSDQTDINAVIDTKIETELANFEHLDYRVVDAVPTPTTAEEGVRYLYKPAGATSYNEYILIDGVIYMIGTTEDVNLENYYTKTEIDDKIKNTKQTTGTATDTYSTDYLNKALQRHIVTLTFNNDSYVNINRSAIVPFDKTTKAGNKLSVENSKQIKIGDGVSKILISSQFEVYHTAQNNCFFVSYVCKNSSSITGSGARILKTSSTAPIGNSSSAILVDVTKDDIIDLRMSASQDVVIPVGVNSHLTVEVVE